MEKKNTPLELLGQPVSTPEELTAAIISTIHAATDLDDLLVDLKDDLISLFDVEQLTFYGVDRDKKELVSRFMLNPLAGVPEIRIPITDTSISGYCARYGKVINLTDAYDVNELATISPRIRFDPSWDKRSGFRTRCMLVVPISIEHKYLMGVLLLINKHAGGRFTPTEEEHAWDIAEALGLAMRNQAQMAPRRSSKFDYLLEQGLVSSHDLHAAIADARRQGVDVESVLVDDYHVPKQEIGQALSRFFGCPFVEFEHDEPIHQQLLTSLNIEFLQANYWVPLQRDPETLEVIMDNPGDLVKVEDIRLLLPGYTLRWAVGLRHDIAQYLQRARRQHHDEELRSITASPQESAEVDTPEQPGQEPTMALDIALMRKAMQATGLHTQREVVEAGLRLLVQTKAQTDIRRLRGRIQWQGELEALRLRLH